MKNHIDRLVFQSEIRMDKVSAIVTTYQREFAIVKRALDSIAAQTYEDMEIILVDDNRDENPFSEDLEKGTKGYSNCFYCRTEEGKHGAQAARNTGIKMATGRYLAFLDDDDVWYPEKIRLQIQALAENTHAGLCYCNGSFVQVNDEREKRRIYNENDFSVPVTYQRLLRGDCIGTTTQAVVRREVFESCGAFDETLEARQDYEMWIRISRKYEIVGVDERLFDHFVYGNEQISRKWEKCVQGHTAIFRKYYDDIKSDPAARFNYIFYMAHYFRTGGKSAKALLWYSKAFFISPVLFFKMGCIKISQIRGK